VLLAVAARAIGVPGKSRLARSAAPSRAITEPPDGSTTRPRPTVTLTRGVAPPLMGARTHLNHPTGVPSRLDTRKRSRRQKLSTSGRDQGFGVSYTW
jgi:hypothetical protein